MSEWGGEGEEKIERKKNPPKKLELLADVLASIRVWVFTGIRPFLKKSMVHGLEKKRWPCDWRLRIGGKFLRVSEVALNNE